jgi:hypothetical protein
MEFGTQSAWDFIAHDVGLWHEAADPECPLFGRYGVLSRHPPAIA